MSFLRNKGDSKCGYEKLRETSIKNEDSFFVEIEAAENENLNHNDKNKESMCKQESQQNVLFDNFIEVILTATKRKVVIKKQSENANMQNNEEITVIEATGTKKSILSWARWKKLDKNQAKCFCVILSHYILTFINEIEEKNIDAA